MIYLLEDDESIRELLCYSLQKTGNDAKGFAAPSGLYEAIAEQLPELILLDVMLPEEDGLTVLGRLRGSAQTADIPVIMLTAKGSEFDKVTALDAGADDYIVKPFGVMELVARVRAVLRRANRTEAKPEDELYAIGDMTLSRSMRQVKVAGEEIKLTYKEFELLLLLFENRGKVLSRDRILRDVWDYEFDGENRTVDVHIRTMRQKLGSAGDLIETIRGVGYKLGN